mmetsp:Transcript_8317/g.30689  ORF Transcript_8317/g.30689 Transcript_8317/m.30689 type:complete len:230 (-) Transcript_8317:362-1051(-)
MLLAACETSPIKVYVVQLPQRLPPMLLYTVEHCLLRPLPTGLMHPELLLEGPQALEDILQIRSDGLERLGPELQLLMDVPKQLRTALIEGLHLVGCSRQVPQRVVLTALQLRNLQALRDLKQQAAGLANIPLVVGLRTGSLAVSLRPLLPRGSIRPHVCVRAVHRSSGQVQGGERPAQCVVTVQPFVRTRLCVRRSIFSFTVHRLKALLEVPRDLLPVALGAFSHSLVA